MRERRDRVRPHLDRGLLLVGLRAAREEGGELSEITYQIIYGDCRGELAELISSLMRDGWAPQGGICAVLVVAPTYERDSCYAFYQAMVRTPSTGDVT